MDNEASSQMKNLAINAHASSQAQGASCSTNNTSLCTTATQGLAVEAHTTCMSVWLPVHPYTHLFWHSQQHPGFDSRQTMQQQQTQHAAHTALQHQRRLSTDGLVQNTAMHALLGGQQVTPDSTSSSNSWARQ
jgi:hypothetical protein